jgi:parallel beta-helix repeat protein
MKRARHFSHLAAGICLIVAAIMTAPTAQAAQAETIHVDTTEFISENNGNCDLWEALEAARTDAPVDGCEAGGNLLPDIIAFDIGAGGAQTIAASVTVNVDSPVYISGGSQAGYAGVPLIKITSSNSPVMQVTAAGVGSTIKALQVTDTAAASPLIDVQADDVTVIANYIGTDGTSKVGTATVGLELYDSSGSHVGGTTADKRNVIGSALGIYILLGGGHTIQDNYFGVTAAGNALLTGMAATANYGILMGPHETSNNTIRDNVISGGFQNGIYIQQNSHDNLVAGNIIGLGADGVTLIGNVAGVTIEGGGHNTIGGTTAADRNVISGNGYNVEIRNYTDDGTIVATGNLIQGNYIGTTADGMSGANPGAIYGINTNGIRLTAGHQTSIGGATSAHGNVIAGNDRGIYVLSDATATQILSNMIGTNADGTAALVQNSGISLGTGAGAMIGDGVTPGNNLISGNESGISLGNGTTVTIYSNRIGLAAHGNSALGNTNGIVLTGTSSATVAENWIAHNTTDGMKAYGEATIPAASTDNCFSSNGEYGVRAFTGLTGSLIDNWWGSPTGPTHSSNPGGTGDAVSDGVTFIPYLAKAPAACQRAPSDFDGDGRTDPAKFFPATGSVWWFRTSDEVWDSAALDVDVSSYVPRSDFDGDGMVDPAKFVQPAGAVWYLQSSDGAWGSLFVGDDYSASAAGSDFDGDGRTDLAKYLSGAGSVWYYKSSTGTWQGTYIGSDAAPYLAGSDYDGDGKTDMAKYVPAAGAIWYLGSGTDTWQGTYIGSDGTPVSGSDFDGDGLTDMAKFLTGSNSLWYRQSSTGTWVGVYLGPGTFTYVTAADFDRDGKTDPAKFDTGSQSMWYLSSISGLWDGMYMGDGTYEIVN